MRPITKLEVTLVRSIRFAMMPQKSFVCLRNEGSILVMNATKTTMTRPKRTLELHESTQMRGARSTQHSMRR